MESEPIEELDDKERVGADVAQRARRKQAMREGSVDGGGEGGGRPGNPTEAPQPTTEGAAQSNESDDHKASQRQAAKPQPPSGSSLVSKAKSGGSTRKVVRGASNKIKKRVAIAIATALATAVVGLFGLFAEKLIDIEENIVHYFDKRMEHTLQQEVGKAWVKVREDKGEESPNQDHPIEDAYGSIDESTLAADLGVTIQQGADGKWNDFKDANGDKVDASDAALENPDSPVEAELGARFPLSNFYRFNARTNLIDAAFGVVRKFLPSKDEPSSSDPKAIEQEIDTEYTARINDTDGPPESSEVSQVQQDAKNTIEQDAGDVSNGEDEATVDAPAGEAVIACALQGIVSKVAAAAPLLRSAALMRYSFIILSTADQLKRGDLQPAQLAVFMTLMQGFEKSGGWQRITGGDKNATITNLDNYSVNGTKGSVVGKINGVLTSIPVLGTVCSAVNSTVGQIVAAGAAIFGDVDGFGELASALGKLVGTYAVFDELSKELVTIGTNLVNNTFLDNNMSADQRVDATIAGYDSYSQVNARGTGAERLTPVAVNELNNAADHDDQEAAMQHSVAYRLLSPAYDQSLVSRLILKMPASPDELTNAFSSGVAALLSPLGHSQMLAFQGLTSAATPSALADNGADDTEDPSGFGVAQFGFPDSLLQKYPDPQVNEDWVINYLATAPDPATGQPEPLFDPGTPSSSELTDQNDSHEDLYHDFVRECLTEVDPNKYLNDPTCDASNTGPQDSYEHFRIYRLDLLIANYIHTMNNDQDDQTPGGGSGSGASPTPAPTDGSAPCSSLQDCAKQIQQLHSAGTITYSVDASEIEANINLEASGQQPKFDGDQETITTASPLILEAIVALAQQGSVQLNSYIDGSSHTDPSNPHHMGVAIDVGAFEGTTLGYPNVAETQKVEQIVGQILPADSRFGADFYTDTSWTSPITVDGKQFYTGQDAPAHLHFDVLNVSGS